MNDPGSDGYVQSIPPPRGGRFALNPWLQVCLLIIALVVVAIIAWAIFGGLKHVFVLFGASLLLAFLIGSLVDRLEHRMHRGLAILAAYVLVLAVTLLLLWILVNPFITQLRELAKSATINTGAQFDLLTGVSSFASQFGISVTEQDLEKQIGEYVKSNASAILTNLTGIVKGVVSFSTDLLVILAMSIFMLLDGRSLNNRVLRLIPDGPRESALFFEATLSKAVGGYARGQIVVATLVGLLAFIGCVVLGVNYPAVIAVAAFVFEFIPLLGPVLGMAVAMLIAAFQPWPLVLWVFIYFVIIQQVESNLIVPRISGGAVGLHPLVVLVVILAGVELGGLMGALVAVPLAGMLTVFGMALYLDMRGNTHLLVPARHSLANATARAPALSLPPPQTVPALDAPTPAPSTTGDSQPAPQRSIWSRVHRPANHRPPDPRGAELMKEAPPAALMFVDQLRVVLKEQDRLRSTYETYEARQSAVERQAQGLPESERVAVERSDLQLRDIQ